MRRKIKDIKKEPNGTYRDKKDNIRGEIFDWINSTLDSAEEKNSDRENLK